MTMTRVDPGQHSSGLSPDVRDDYPLVSVLVPAKDEADNLPIFMEQASAAFSSQPGLYEVVVIDDGSVDETWAVLESLAERFPFLRAVRHRARRGIAESLRTGYLSARGSVLVFYPADLQYLPEDIPRLVAPILEGRSDMVTGFKQGEYEKAFVSGVYNRLSRSLFNVPVRDLNSVKAYRREVMDSLPARPDWHRYMIVMAAAQGFTVTEVPVPLYPRHAGKSKFGIGRIPVGVMDMLAVWFELRFATKPLLFFGMMGAGLFMLGVLAGIAAVAWLAFTGVGIRAVWTLIQTCLVVGSVFFATGFIGELVAAQRAETRELRARIEELAHGRDTLL
ncbi:MAG: glycosyltransferase family 2 protein, partial [Gemmatimonadota bacterium]|nr:glycosyltransferase family 2 protein [Gemmatimonadota bacterium]